MRPLACWSWSSSSRTRGGEGRLEAETAQGPERIPPLRQRSMAATAAGTRLSVKNN